MISVRRLLGPVGVVGLMAVTASPALAGHASVRKVIPAAPRATVRTAVASSLRSAPRSAVFQSFNNPNGEQDAGTVDCPGGTVLTGGGALGFSGFSGGQQSMNSSYPTGTASWTAWMNNATGFDSGFYVYAVCIG